MFELAVDGVGHDNDDDDEDVDDEDDEDDEDNDDDDEDDEVDEVDEDDDDEDEDGTAMVTVHMVLTLVVVILKPFGMGRWTYS